MKKNCLTLILPSLLSGCAGISGNVLLPYAASL
ncbi:PilL protein [Escherichia coli]|nr:PilL protein [Escherichia coli]